MILTLGGVSTESQKTLSVGDTGENRDKGEMAMSDIELLCGASRLERRFSFWEKKCKKLLNSTSWQHLAFIRNEHIRLQSHWSKNRTATSEGPRNTRGLWVNRPCDILGTCSGCTPHLAPWKLGQAPTPPQGEWIVGWWFCFCSLGLIASNCGTSVQQPQPLVDHFST